MKNKIEYKSFKDLDIWDWIFLGLLGLFVIINLYIFYLHLRYKI